MKTILLVENEDGDVGLIQRAFKRAQLAGSLRVVKDGDEALDYLLGGGLYGDRSAHPLPDLIFLDLKMPCPDGRELLYKIRSNAAFCLIPVIILSGSDRPVDLRSAYLLGANSYIVKPRRPDGWETILRQTTEYWFGINNLSLPKTGPVCSK